MHQTGLRVDRFLTEAKSLTDVDLAQFAAVDPAFAERARAKRAGFVKVETDDDRAIGKKPLIHSVFIEWMTDHLGPVLKTYRHKAAESEERIAALEARILELEAREAARTGAACRGLRSCGTGSSY